MANITTTTGVDVVGTTAADDITAELIDAVTIDGGEGSDSLTTLVDDADANAAGGALFAIDAVGDIAVNADADDTTDDIDITDDGTNTLTALNVESFTFANGTLTTAADEDNPQYIQLDALTGYSIDLASTDAVASIGNASTVFSWDGAALADEGAFEIASINGTDADGTFELSGIGQITVDAAAANGFGITLFESFQDTIGWGDVEEVELAVEYTSDGGTPGDDSDDQSFTETFTVEVTGAASDDADSFNASNIAGDQSDLDGLGGDDFIAGDEGSDTIYGNDGNDQIFAGSADDGNDVVAGGNGDDVIGGGVGDDVLTGDDDDRVTAGDFDATETGADTIFGGDGDDEIHVGSWNDATSTHTGEEDDTAYAGAGTDTVRGDDGNDILGGGDGDDDIGGGAGNDTIYGGADDGVDIIAGDAGDDTIFAGAGDDVAVTGGSGADTIFNGEGDDAVNGGDGRDTIWGGAGDDQLTGGNGSDTFGFVAGNGDDTIAGLDTGTDSIDFSSVAGLSEDDLPELAVEIGGALVIYYTEDDSVTLTGVTSAELGDIDFIF